MRGETNGLGLVLLHEVIDFMLALLAHRDGLFLILLRQLVDLLLVLLDQHVSRLTLVDLEVVVLPLRRSQHRLGVVELVPQRGVLSVERENPLLQRADRILGLNQHVQRLHEDGVVHLHSGMAEQREVDARVDVVGEDWVLRLLPPVLAERLVER